MSHFKKRIQLFRYPAFRWYLGASILATVGAGLNYIATTWMALHGKASVGSVAIMMLCFWAPGVVLGPFTGVIVDRVPYRHYLLLASNWIRAIVLFIFGWFFLHHHSLNALYLLAFISGLFFSIYIPAAMRLTRELVPEKELLYANSTIDMTFETGNIVGMGLAGLLIAYLGASGALFINAAMFVIAGVLMLFIKREHLNISVSEAKAFNVIRDMKEGFLYIISNKPVFMIYSIQLLIFVEYLTAPVLLAPYSREVLHASVGQFGYIEAALSVGAVFGGFFMVWLADRISLMRTMMFGTILLGFVYAYFTYNKSVLSAEVLYFVVGVAFAMWPLAITRAQEITDIDYQGRVQSCFSSLSGAIIIVVYLAVKLLSHYVPVQLFFWLEVAFTLLSLFLLYRFKRLS